MKNIKKWIMGGLVIGMISGVGVIATVNNNTVDTNAVDFKGEGIVFPRFTPKIGDIFIYEVRNGKWYALPLVSTQQYDKHAHFVKQGGHNYADEKIINSSNVALYGCRCFQLWCACYCTDYHSTGRSCCRG